jgi:hypothetical protein
MIRPESFQASSPFHWRKLDHVTVDVCGLLKHRPVAFSAADIIRFDNTMDSARSPTPSSGLPLRSDWSFYGHLTVSICGIADLSQL